MGGCRYTSKWGISVFALILLVLPLSLNSAPDNNQQYKIGVLPFVDSTGSGGQDLATALARAVQTEIAHSTQLQGRVISLGAGTSPTGIDANKAVEMGRSQVVDAIMLGTVVEASSEESNKSVNGPTFGGVRLGGTAHSVKSVVTLQVELYDVTSGKQIDSFRVTGDASQTKVNGDISTNLGDLSNNGGSFDRSPIGKAFHSAVVDLAKKIAADQGKMTTYSAGSVATSSTNAPPSPVVGSSTGTAAAVDAGTTQPELKSVKIDFVPGERTVFYDDFSDMAQDEPPPHWQVRGGKVALLTGGGVRELDAPIAAGLKLSSPSIAIPKNFTFEVNMMFGNAVAWNIVDKAENPQLTVVANVASPGSVALTFDSAGGRLADATANVDVTKPVTLGIWVQEGRVRGYVNGERVVDVNQVKITSADHLVFSMPNLMGPKMGVTVGLRSIRLAESAPDFSTLLAATGKYVTHGINFDTDSDRLKPESAAVLKQVAGGLEKNPSLKLEIDGYTDSVGDASHNTDLSKRRAQAVQSVLVAQFGIDPGRLTSNGFGASKPIGSNDTPDGRAQNRRVEFIRK